MSTVDGEYLEVRYGQVENSESVTGNNIYLPLNQSVQNTLWVAKATETSEGEPMSRVIMNDMDFTFIEKIPSSTKVYGVIGKIVALSNEDFTYYMLLTANNQRSSLQFIQKSHRHTNTIDHRKILFLKLGELTLSGLRYTFFIARDNMEIIGTKKNCGPRAVEMYNEQLEGKCRTSTTNDRAASQQVAKRRKKALEAHTIPHEDAMKLQYLPDQYEKEDFYKINGIRSFNSGGLVSLVPLCENLNEKPKEDEHKSDYHIATTVENVLGREHTFSTILAANTALEDWLDLRLVFGKERDKIVGAVYDKFFEDISFKLVDESSKPHIFREIKIDIDQVSLCVKKLSLMARETDADRSSFLLLMYTNVMSEVIQDRLACYQTTFLDHKSFCIQARTGGHTYMTAAERRKYVRIPTNGLSDVFKISVKFNYRVVTLKSDTDKEQRQKLEVSRVWKAIKFVAIWLDTESPQATKGQHCRVKNLDRNDCYSHGTISGPMLSLLTVLLLATDTECGLNIAVETYHHKSRATRSYDVSNSNRTVSLADAQMLADAIKGDLERSAPFIISRFGSFCEMISNESISKCVLTDDDIDFKWGVGCTVVTLCETEPSQPTSNTEPRSQLVPFVSEECRSSSLISEQQLRKQSLRYRSSRSNAMDSDDEDNIRVSCDEVPTVTESPLGVSSDGDASDCYNRLTKLKQPPVVVDLGQPLQPGKQYAAAYTVVCPKQLSFASVSSTPKAYFLDTAGIRLTADIERRERSRPNINVRPSFGETVYSSDDSSGDRAVDIDSDSAIESNDSGAEEIPMASKNQKYRKTEPIQNKIIPFIALATGYKHDVTYPCLGGVLPLSMQPCTFSRKGKENTIAISINDDDAADSANVIRERIQTYSVFLRNAAGECGVKLKSSTEIAHCELDIHQTNEKSAFNMHSLVKRITRAENHGETNFATLAAEGNPGRIEIAYKSPSTSRHMETLTYAIKDILEIVLNTTKSFSAATVAKIGQLVLKSEISRLETLNLMLSEHLNDPRKYNETVAIRLESAARLGVFYSGKQILKRKHIFLPRLSYMACRPIHRPMGPLSQQCREQTLTLGGNSAYDIFTDNLLDIRGRSHTGIQTPLFEKQFDTDVMMDSRESAVYCSKCKKIFSTRQTVAAFDMHSCTDTTKGRPLSIQCQSFADYQSSIYDTFDIPQKSAIRLIEENEHNVFLTGFAGVGKSKVLKFAIARTLMRFGMHAFAVVSTTKIAAGLVDGITFHSFIGLNPGDDNDDNDYASSSTHLEYPREHARSLVASDKGLFLKFLRTIFIDECGMTSHDQFSFLDTVLQEIRQSKKPFGGVQLVICGDCLQMCPIVKSKGETTRIFFFESPSFLNGNFLVVYLKRCYRQKNRQYIDILNRMRYGETTEQDLIIINTTWGNKVCRNSLIDTIKALEELCVQEANGAVKSRFDYKLKKVWHNRLEKYMDHINAKLPLEESEFAKETIKHFERFSLKAETDFNTVISAEHVENQAISAANSRQRHTKKYICESLDVSNKSEPISIDMQKHLTKETKLVTSMEVTVGMVVTVTTNDVGVFIANNSTAVISEITVGEDGDVATITISPCVEPHLVPHHVVLGRQTRTVNKYWNTADKRYKFANLSRTQFPIKPADSATIQSIQGQTRWEPLIMNLQRVAVKKRSHYGMAYVAASRTVNETLFTTLHPLTLDYIIAHPLALAFDRYHRDQVDYITAVDYTYPELIRFKKNIGLAKKVVT